ncbi:MAG TPA: hypothetical protein VFX59_29950 [Polyangiales bacterium]|nr:hypothetical protein [Polyangiales bacterium]
MRAALSSASTSDKNEICAGGSPIERAIAVAGRERVSQVQVRAELRMHDLACDLSFPWDLELDNDTASTRAAWPTPCGR